MSQGEPPTSDLWRPGDDPGQRMFVTLFGPDSTSAAGGSGPFVTESGEVISSVTMAYETWGALNDDRSNAVLVLHALTGGSHAAGPAGPGHAKVGWWDGLIGPGRPIDTDRYYVVCPSVLGGCQGTTGPVSPAPDGDPWGARFPVLTIRDQVAAEVALADALGIGVFAAVVGGSMGGMRVLEWCVGSPDRLQRAVVIAIGAWSTADEIALSGLQIRAIQADPAFRSGEYWRTGEIPEQGMAIARGIGQYSYRTEAEFEDRFGRRPQGNEDPYRGGRFAVESYLDHHGAKLASWFDANTYITLSRAMSLHDVGRDRGGVPAALSRVTAEVAVAGINSDRLYPFALQQKLAAMLPGRRPAAVIDSPAGHDGFLTEIDQMGAIIRTVLDPPY